MSRACLCAVLAGWVSLAGLVRLAPAQEVIVPYPAPVPDKLVPQPDPPVILPPPSPLGTVTTRGPTLHPEDGAPPARGQQPGGCGPIRGFFRCMAGGCPSGVEDANCFSSRSYCTFFFGSCRGFWSKPIPDWAPNGPEGQGGCGCK
jgi:hypothetical protein